MAANQLIATLDCFKQEIILDVPGETVDGTFTAILPDGSNQTLTGVLPLSLSTVLEGTYTFIEDSINTGNSTVSSVLPVTLNAKFTDCANISELSICLFNLNLRYEKAICKNKKEGEKERIKLDRALQLITLLENVAECGLDNLKKYKDEFISITNCDECEKLDDDIWGDYAVYGCTDSAAPNYNPAANIDDGSCLGTSITGCTNPLANNYNANATIDDGSCVFDVYGCTDPTATNYDPNATIDDGSCIATVYGCTNPNSFNYDPLANTDDGSCVAYIYGCTDATALNYFAGATHDDGSCIYAGSNTCANNDTTVSNGNTFNTYINYDPTSLYDCNGEALGTAGDSSTGPQNTGYDSCCIASVFGCSDPTAFNYNPAVTVDDGSCQSNVYGCTDPTALNYSPAANILDPNNPCCYVAGCMDATATNYDPNACIDNGSCLYCSVYGCTDPTAANYDQNADCDDGSCTYSACAGVTLVPDTVFEEFLEDNGMGDGTTGNGQVLKSNICDKTSLVFMSFYTPNFNAYGNINTFMGLQDFVDLEEFRVQSNFKQTYGNNGILDFNQNTKLITIQVSSNSEFITEVLIDQCVDLKFFILSNSGNISATIDFTNNTKLEVIHLGGTDTDQIGINNCTDLESFKIDGGCEVGDNQPFDLSFTNKLKVFSAKNRASLGTVTLSPTLDLTQLTDFVTGTTTNNTNCDIKVGAGDVPGTSGGTGLGGLKTRVEYMESTFPNNGPNKVTSTAVTFII